MLKTIALAAGLTALLALPAIGDDYTIDNDGHVTNCSLDMSNGYGLGFGSPREISRDTGRHCTAWNSGKAVKYAALAARERREDRHWDDRGRRWDYD